MKKLKNIKTSKLNQKSAIIDELVKSVGLSDEKVRTHQSNKKNTMTASSVIDERTGERKLVIKFVHNKGMRATAVVDESLINERQNFVKALVKQGASLPGLKADQNKIIDNLISQIVRADSMLAVKSGFKEKKGFVLGKVCLGSAKDTHVSPLTYAELQTGYIGAREGNVDSWNASTGKICAQSSFAMFAVCAALAAPLSQYVSDRIDERKDVNELVAETATFLFIGDSASGKTTLARVAMSTMGNKPLEDWNVTPRRLAELAEEHNNLLLILDDAEKTDPDETTVHLMLRRIAQIIPAGKGKNVSEIARKSGLPDLFYNTWGLASALDNEDAPFEENGWNPSAGALMRIIPILLPAPANGGIFDRISEATASVSTESEELARKLDYALKANFGAVFPKWIKKLLAKNRAASIIRLRDEFVQKQVVASDPWDTRIARKFGAVYAAGVLASRLNIIDWSESEIESSVRNCYEIAASYRVSRLGSLKKLQQDFYAALRDEERFAKVKSGCATLETSMLGVRAKYKGKTVLAVRNDELAVFCGNKSKARLINSLAKDGVLIRGKGKAGTIQLPVKLKIGKAEIAKPRFWLLSRNVLRKRETAGL